jgi:hypothetical protein
MKKNVTFLLFPLGIILLGSLAQAALPDQKSKNITAKNTNTQSNKLTNSDSEAETILALRLPLEMRLNRIRKMGQNGFDSLNKIAFNKMEVLDHRWRAITAMGRLYPRLAQNKLDVALKSPEWFMRNAAALVLRYGDRAWSIKWSRILMHDPAMVVRTAAVENLLAMNATETSDLLWEKMQSTENFRGGQSLWIRRQIASALIELSSPRHTDSFVKLLHDKDIEVRQLAMNGLRKQTRQDFKTTQDWLRWHANNQKAATAIQ